MSSDLPKLIIGNANTSSWSLRAWLALRLAEVEFETVKIKLRRAETKEDILAYSPSGKVPVLVCDGQPIWDSLAIGEFVAELKPEIWPDSARERALARSISSEMHSGFPALRAYMPMDMNGRFTPSGHFLHDVARDIDRIKSIWRECLNADHAGGPFLFGAFSLADAMYAPVASRFVTYGIELDRLLEDYVDAVMSFPHMIDWQEMAADELALDELADDRDQEDHQGARVDAPVRHQPRASADDDLSMTDAELARGEEKSRPETPRPDARPDPEAAPPPANPFDEGDALFDSGGSRPIHPKRVAQAPAIKPIGDGIRRRR